MKTLIFVKNIQITNFVRFCEVIVKTGDCKIIHLDTAADNEAQRLENLYIFEQLGDSLLENGVTLKIKFNPLLHDREIKLNNGWHIKMGRGLDSFQSLKILPILILKNKSGCPCTKQEQPLLST